MAQRIISPDWITDSTRVHAHTGSDSDYGYHWQVEHELNPIPGLHHPVQRQLILFRLAFQS